MSRSAAARHGILALLAVAVAMPPGAAARSPDAAPANSPAATRSLPATKGRVDAAPRGLIVTYRDGTTEASRRSIRAAAVVDVVGKETATAVEVVRPRGRSLEAAAAALRARPEVADVSLDAYRSLFVNPTGEPAWSEQWGHHNTGQVVGGYIGQTDVDVDGLEALQVLPAGTSSVVVAVIDDGVDFTHPDLAGTAWVNPGESGANATNGVDDDLNGYVDDVNGWDFCNDDNSVHDHLEDYHGTAVASTIAAPVNGSGVAGIAPGVRIMALKFLQNEPDPNNPACGNDSMAIEAINYAKLMGARIMNASWGGGAGTPALKTAIEQSGALFVAASGNESMDLDVNPSYPAAFNSANILSVAAIHNEGGITDFSNVGRTTVDISAPGEDVVLALPPVAGQSTTHWWAYMNGTSFSAPYVAGIAALGAAVRPNLLTAPTVLRSRVLATGTPLPATAGLTATGRLANARRMLDFTPPTLTGGVSVLPTVATLGLSSIKVRLSWGQAVDDLGMGSYRIEQRRNGGAWTQLVAVNATRTYDVVISLSGTYEFRVSPRDALGNLGAPVYSRVVSGVRYDDTGAHAVYSGAWTTVSLSGATGGKVRYTTASNASVTFTFNGRTGAFVAPLSSIRSSFKVYVDNVYVRTVSLYSATTKPPTVVFTTGTMALGNHTIKLVHTRVGSRIRGDVDAFIVLR